MHPYEMGALLKQRRKEESIKFRYGSLYTVIDLLLQRGYIAARETAREGRRPSAPSTRSRRLASPSCMPGWSISSASRPRNIRSLRRR